MDGGFLGLVHVAGAEAEMGLKAPLPLFPLLQYFPIPGRLFFFPRKARGAVGARPPACTQLSHGQ